jgi:thiamine biosynthesis lipoprotein ApbE
MNIAISLSSGKFVLAKVIFILGPEMGLALARAEKVEALLIDPAGRAHATPGFPPLQSQEGM